MIHPFENQDQEQEMTRIWPPQATKHPPPTVTLLCVWQKTAAGGRRPKTTRVSDHFDFVDLLWNPTIPNSETRSKKHLCPPNVGQQTHPPKCLSSLCLQTRGPRVTTPPPRICRLTAHRQPKPRAQTAPCRQGFANATVGPWARQPHVSRRMTPTPAPRLQTARPLPTAPFTPNPTEHLPPPCLWKRYHRPVGAPPLRVGPLYVFAVLLGTQSFPHLGTKNNK